MKIFARTTLFALMVQWCLAPQALVSCPVCTGNADSNSTEGINMAIVTMVGISGTMMGLVTGFFIYLNKRARNSGNIITKRLFHP